MHSHIHVIVCLTGLCMLICSIFNIPVNRGLDNGSFIISSTLKNIVVKYLFQTGLNS